MVTSFHALISRILNIPAGQVERTIGLLGEGATILHQPVPQRGDRRTG